MKTPTLWALALLAVVASAGAAQTPPMIGRPVPEVVRKSNKGVLIHNVSNKTWTLGLNTPETGAPVGTLNAHVYKTSDMSVVSEGEFSPGRPIALKQNECVILVPPEWSLGTMFGMTRSQNFSRTFSLTDENKKKVTFNLTIPPAGDPNRPRPVAMFKELADYTALYPRVFSLDPAGDHWVIIIAPNLP